MRPGPPPARWRCQAGRRGTHQTRPPTRPAARRRRSGSPAAPGCSVKILYGHAGVARHAKKVSLLTGLRCLRALAGAVPCTPRRPTHQRASALPEIILSERGLQACSLKSIRLQGVEVPGSQEQAAHHGPVVLDALQQRAAPLVGRARPVIHQVHVRLDRLRSQSYLSEARASPGREARACMHCAVGRMLHTQAGDCLQPTAGSAPSFHLARTHHTWQRAVLPSNRVLRPGAPQAAARPGLSDEGPKHANVFGDAVLQPSAHDMSAPRAASHRSGRRRRCRRLPRPRPPPAGPWPRASAAAASCARTRPRPSPPPHRRAL